MKKKHLLSALVILLLLGTAVWAADQLVIADFAAWPATGVPKDWELKVKTGKADYGVVRDDGIAALRLKSVDSSFSFQREVDVDLKAYPVLSWKWKVTKLPAGGDFRKSGTDDQAAQLFVAFGKTKSIVYIWDTSAPRGLTQDTSPVFFMHVQVVVVRSGPEETGKWITESRNVYEDYKKFFGEEPPHVEGMRIQINSQHTGTEAESYFADVAFRKQ